MYIRDNVDEMLKTVCSFAICDDLIRIKLLR